MNYDGAAYIYAITNTTNGKKYVGSTVQRPKARWGGHRHLLRKGAHHSYKLQAAWSSAGEAAFIFSVICVVPSTQAVAYEAFFIPGAAYNVAQDPSRNGIETRWAGHIKKVKLQGRSLSECQKAIWADPAAREKRIVGLRRAAATPEARERRSKASKGRVMSHEAVSKMARAKWRPVHCPQLQISFLSQKHAADYFGVLRTSINNAVAKGCLIERKFALEKVLF